MTNRNVLILALCQAVGISGYSAIVLLGGIIGADLAPTEALATLPVSICILGVAVSTVPAALLMKRIGRRNGFVAASIVAIGAALLAAYAVAQHRFALFCTGTFFIGVNVAFVQQYRFAAGESADQGQTGRAVSLVLLGGAVAGFLGPELAQRGRDWLPAGRYAGSFVALAALYALAALFLLFYGNLRAHRTVAQGDERPLLIVVRQPLFLLALLTAAVGYSVMSFVMTAAPIQLHRLEGFSLDQTTLVIQSHIVAMYLPSLFTGALLERLGLSRVLLIGLAAFLVSIIAALVSVHLLHYWVTLVLLGLGWNFLFVGGTVLLTRTYRPLERFKVQAVNDLVVFGSQATAALSSGTVLFVADWRTLSVTSLLPLLVTLVAVLALRRRMTPASAVGVG